MMGLTPKEQARWSKIGTSAGDPQNHRMKGRGIFLCLILDSIQVPHLLQNQLQTGHVLEFSPFQDQML